MSKPNAFLSRAEILDAAEQTLRRFGPDKTSVTDVAKLLGVSHGTLYRHFPSKAALREAVTERWLDENIVAPLAVIPETPEGNSLELVRAYLVKLMELKRHYAEQDGEMFKMYAAVTADAAGLVEVHIGRIIAQLGKIIAAGQQRQAITADMDSKVLARSLIHATARFHHPAHAYEWRNPQIDDEFGQLWTLLARGLAG